MKTSFWHRDREFKLSLHEKAPHRLGIILDRKSYDVDVEFINHEEMLLKINGKVFDVIINTDSTTYNTWINGRCYRIRKKTALEMLGGQPSDDRLMNVKTSMPGRIIKILAKSGESVQEGDAVLILEAMKMQNEIKSPKTGKVGNILPKQGDSVEAGSLLFTID